MGLHRPNLRGQKKRGRPLPLREGQRHSIGVHNPNSRGHAKTWVSISPTEEATPKCGVPHP